MSNVLVEKNKLDVLATAISNKSGEPLKLTLDEMVEAVDGIETGGGEPNLQAKSYTVTSNGTSTITADSGYDGLSEVEVNVPSGLIEGYINSSFVTESGVRKWKIRAGGEVLDGGYFATGTIATDLYNFNAIATGTTVTPTESAQTIGGANTMMEGAVTVNAVPRASFGIPTNNTTVENGKWNYTRSYPNFSAGYLANHPPVEVSISLEDKTVTPSASQQVITPTDRLKYLNSVTVSAMPSGTEGTPTATKGTVSNHSVSVTPSVTNTTGYITGSTKTGTAVTVSASELVSGSETKTQNGTYDVTNLAEIVVDVQGGGGGGTLKNGVIRPDAELVQRWSQNKLLVSELGKTIPAYQTSAKSVIASANLSPTIPLDFANYEYFALFRFATIPIYSTNEKGSGRQDYQFSSSILEFFYVSGELARAIDSDVSSQVGISSYSPITQARNVYWTSANSITQGQNGYGCYQNVANPTVSNFVATFKAPSFSMRGNATYFSSNYWSLLTDVRIQWIIEVYRVARGSMGVNGWCSKSQIEQLYDDITNNHGIIT